MDTGLKEKVILITGGSAGIGKAALQMYAKEEGAKVAFTYYRNKERAEQLCNEINDNDGMAMAVYMNLGDHESIEKAVEAVTGEWGGPDVLVNNAVRWGNTENRGKRFEDMPMEQWQETIGVNLFGTVKITQLVVPFMRKSKWGRIVQVSSDVALDGFAGSGPYGSLKAALFGLTASMVEELSSDGILTNVVIPSWTLTDRARETFPEAFQKDASKAFPTGRITLPEDVASLILYLGSAANGHVNGEHIRVTGKCSLPLMTKVFKESREQAKHEQAH